MDTFLESFDEFVSQTGTVLGKLEQTEDTNDELNLEIKSLLEENQECRNLNVILTRKLNDKDLELQLVRRKYNERIEEEGGDITARAELINTKHEVCRHKVYLIQLNSLNFYILSCSWRLLLPK